MSLNFPFHIPHGAGVASRVPRPSSILSFPQLILSLIPFPLNPRKFTILSHFQPFFPLPRTFYHRLSSFSYILHHINRYLLFFLLVFHFFFHFSLFLYIIFFLLLHLSLRRRSPLPLPPPRKPSLSVTKSHPLKETVSMDQEGDLFSLPRVHECWRNCSVARPSLLALTVFL